MLGDIVILCEACYVSEFGGGRKVVRLADVGEVAHVIGISDDEMLQLEFADGQCWVSPSMVRVGRKATV